MKSRLAIEARQALAVDLRRMTAEERLATYVRHCRLMAQLRLAGRKVHRTTRQPAASNAD